MRRVPILEENLSLYDLSNFPSEEQFLVGDCVMWVGSEDEPRPSGQCVGEVLDINLDGMMKIRWGDGTISQHPFVQVAIAVHDHERLGEEEEEEEEEEEVEEGEEDIDEDGYIESDTSSLNANDDWIPEGDWTTASELSNDEVRPQASFISFFLLVCVGLSYFVCLSVCLSRTFTTF